MEDYRKRAHEKYIQDKIKKEEQEFESIKQELDFMSLLCDIDEYIENIKTDFTSDNIILNISHIQNVLISYIDINEDKIIDIHERIIKLTNIINSIMERRLFNNEKLKEISNYMKDLYQIANITIDIELMDTSGDEEYARQLENTEE